MNEVLVTAGAASIILAVVGGGARAFGVEVPVLRSRARQGALGVVGVAFLVAAALVPNDGGDGGGGVASYRQAVLAACRSANQGGSPLPNSDGVFERASYVDFFRTNLSSTRSILDGLWSRPVPGKLKADAAQAHRATDGYLARSERALNELERQLPNRFDLQQSFEALQQVGAKLRAPSAAVEQAMSRLAGAPCTPSTVGGTGG